MTDKSVELVDGLVVRSPPSGRRTYNMAAKRALVQLCQRPGVSVAGTALAHGINANLLRRWITRYGPESKPTNGPIPGASLVPVNTSPPPNVRVGQPLDCSIEFTFMNTSIRVRGAVDARALGAVLDCLAQRA